MGIQQMFLGASAGKFYEVANSLRFNSDGGNYLDWTPSSSGNRKTFTLSWWMKRGQIDTNQRIFAVSSGAVQFSMMFDALGRLYFYGNVSSPTGTFERTTEYYYRDFSAWYHVVLSVDTTQGTDSDRFKMYVNGEEITSYVYSSYPAQNTDMKWNSTYNQKIGGFGGYYYDGYLAEVFHVDGQALSASDFGETNAATGQWLPKDCSEGITYGTNGFYLKFNNTSDLGEDSSGNGNDWTANNFDGNATLGFNLDSTSAPFTDIDSGLTITNTGSTTTATAPTNSFNLTTVGTFNGSSKWLNTESDIILPSAYTIDYYFYADSSQVSNATPVDIGTNHAFRDYGSGSTRYIRIKDSTNNYTDYSYSISANTWYHIRITNTGIWRNGTSVNSSPRSMSGRGGKLYIGTYSNLSSYAFNGEIGPVRVAYKNLGAPPSGGLVANVDGTLSRQFVANSGCDVLVDSPTSFDDGGNGTGNYCTINRLNIGSNTTLSEGNLKTTCSNSTWTINNRSVGTIGVRTGKWYWECHISNASYNYTGMISTDNLDDAYPGQTSASIGMQTSVGTYWGGGSQTGNGAGTGSDVTIMYAFDADNKKMWFGVDGTWFSTGSNQGNPSAGTYPSHTGFGSSNTTYFPANCTYGSSTCQYNFGAGSFAHTPPTDFKALNTYNLDDPTFKDPSKHFDIATATGANILSTATGLTDGADLVWIKDYATSPSHHMLFNRINDSGMDGTPHLRSNESHSESTAGTYSAPSGNSVSYVWNAGSSTVTNTDGDITSSVRANPSAGFSMVTYTRPTWNGGPQSVGHGLGAAPGLIITKGRDQAAGWYTYHKGFNEGVNPHDYYMTLNTSTREQNLDDSWGSHVPNSTVFGDRHLGGPANTPMICYLWTSIPDYSMISSYTGNGLTGINGKFVYCGFKPAFILHTRTEQNGWNWWIRDTARDPANPADHRMRADTDNSESSGDGYDIHSNGFQMTLSNGDYNATGKNYIFAAFAEKPFKYLNAR